MYAINCKKFQQSERMCSQRELPKENDDHFSHSLPNPKERCPKPILLWRSVMKCFDFDD